MNNNFVYKILEEGGYGNEESVRKEKFFKQWLNVSLFDSIAEISRLHFVGGSLITVLGKIILFLVVLLIRIKVGGESSDVLRSIDWLRFIFFPV